MEQLKSSIRRRQRLPVAVFSTPAAEAVLARTGLSIVDLLRPVSLVNNLNGQCTTLLEAEHDGISILRAMLLIGMLHRCLCCHCPYSNSTHACWRVLYAGARGAVCSLLWWCHVPACTRGMPPA